MEPRKKIDEVVLTGLWVLFPLLRAGQVADIRAENDGYSQNF